ncbi:MAG: carboxypeptidase-like regulatory domain-containing protein [Acidobacteriaceae bacterium]
MKFFKSILLWILLCAVPIPGFAQEFRGTISGTVTDPSTAAVVGVEVVATEVHTGTKVQTVTDGTGHYVLPFLLPGDYNVFVEATGFKRYVRQGVHLSSSAHVVADVALQIGSNSQSIKVTADAPLLDVADATIGQTITTKQVEDLPLDGRTPMMLAQLSIGVIATSNPSLVHPFDNNGAAAWSIGGTPSQTSEILLDGSPDMMWSGALAYSPPQDAVSEVTVKMFDTDAAYGHTNGGVANQVLKSGTNQIHGSAYEFTQVSALDGNTFFNNRNGKPRQVTHFNQYGLTAGGPFYLPKVYDGRNKLFWFFAFEKLNDSQPTTDITSVPTAAERNGDFSSLLALGSQYQIYNPYSATLSGTTIHRQPFANNIIPQGMISPIAQAYMKYYPHPNIAGTSDGFDNYANNNTSVDNYDNELGRVDWNMSAQSHLFFDFRHNYRLQSKNNYFGNIATGVTLSRENWGSVLDEVYTFNPTTVMDVRGNWTYLREVHGSPSVGFDPTQLGFPSYVTSSSQHLQMPFIGFTGSCGSQTSYQCLGDTGSALVPSSSYQIFSDVVKVIGNHTLKMGVDARQYRLDDIAYGNSVGSYTFGTNWTSGPTSGSAVAPFGQDFAAFLLGLPSSGSYQLNARESLHSNYFAGFLQDDWRVSNTLTLNMGLRFDRDNPYIEKLGRVVNGFDATTASPIAAAAQAAYAANPIPQIPASSFAVNGGLTFATPGNGALYSQNSHLFSPRFGFSWSPARLKQSTVIRGGFAMFVSPVVVSNLSGNGNYSSTPIINQQGFSATTQFVSTLNNYLSPANTINDPYPSGISLPTGSSLGLATYLGQAISFFNPEMKDPYSLRWNLGFQRSLTANTVLEVDYVGNHALHIPIAVTQLNVIPRQYLSTLTIRDTAVINTLSATVANPFKNLLPGTSLNGSKVSVAQLLSPYPQFPNGEGSTSNGVLLQNNTIGNSYFNALDARVEHRLSHGLSVIGVYGFSKLIEADTYLNDTDLAAERRISPFDHSQHVVTAFTYHLPIGSGQRVNLQSPWANALGAGWTVNGIYTFQTGAPIYWSNDMVYNGQPLNLDRRATTGTAFNTAAFDTNSKDQFQYHVRTFPSTIASARQNGINNLDASLLKNFSFTERSYLQLRFEAFNAVNHPNFGAPNVTPTNKAFGEITSQTNLPRSIQLGARLVF